MNHLGIEQYIKAGGKTFRLSRFTRRLLRAWFDWSNTYLESPLDIVSNHFNTFPDTSLLVTVGEQIATQRYSFSDEAVWNLWGSEPGVRQSFQLMFLKYHPEIDANPIADEIGIDKVESLIAKANGIPPTNAYDIDRRFFMEQGLIEPVSTKPAPCCRWEEFDRSLFQNLHLTPDQIDELTPTEISVLTAKEETSGISESEAIAMGKLQLALTPEQQLYLAKLKYRS